MADRIYTRARRKELRAAIDEGRSVRKIAEHINREYMEDGKAVIHVNVQELYNPLSMGNMRQLNGDIFDYIEQSANLLPSMVPIRAVLHGVAEEDRKQVPDLFRLHYRLVAQDRLWDQRMNRWKMFYMTGVGLIFILAYLFFAFRQEDDLFLEILSVIGSFSLWEAANCFLIERREINKALNETAQFLTMEIAFA